MLAFRAGVLARLREAGAPGIVIERLGRFHRVLGSGLHFVTPFIDSPRTFTWRKTYIDVNGTIQDRT